MITVENGNILVGKHIINIHLCMEMKSMVPIMNFSQILSAFAEGSPINNDDFGDACDVLEKEWLALSPEDVAWESIEDATDSIGDQ